jgi:histidyl-tRNA synthetase
MTIQPRTLKGFRDFLPADMRIRQHVFAVFRAAFEKYGYEPLETPVLEYADILMGKYGEEAEGLMYRFTDRGDRDVAMKYDLTVPACRVLAQYQNDLPLPFKRYQIQPVWRAENTQKGRFREFYQCDADTFGTTSKLVEAEYIQMGIEALTTLGFNDVVVRINNRKIIDGIVQYAGATENEFYAICIAVDKLDKIGIDGVQNEMRSKDIPEQAITKITEIISLPQEDSLDRMQTILTGFPVAEEGIAEIQEIFAYLKQANVDPSFYMFDTTIIRGLSYYTGPVWEFSIRDGGVGSVGGGGRYDGLVKLYAGKDIPAAGGSFGIERLIEIIKDRRMMSDLSGVDVLVTIFSPEQLAYSVKIAAQLRAAGKRVALYPDPQAKMEKQLKYANKKGIQRVAIAGKTEQDNNAFKLKNMQDGTESVESLT